MLAYNNAKKTNFSKSDFDWSQSRIIFICREFSEKQKMATDFKDLSIELWEVRRYANDTLMFSPIGKSKHAVSISPLMKSSNKVIEDLKKLKSAFCEKMYDESNPNTRLADIIEQQSIRNKAGEDLKVLSVSNRYGFVEQSEQFEDRTVASEDTSNYKIVALNDFAYNPARINVGSIARLKNFKNGIVSPMYICFRCKGSVLPEFLEPFFSTKYFSLEMGKRLEGSVRMCLSFEGLCNIPINIPSYEEQTETAKKVNALSEKQRQEESYSILLSAQKEYILSQMFI